MTREDLLKGNAEIAAEFGKDLRTYCPDVKHVVVIFNPADITGLVTLIYSGLKPSQVSTLAALDSHAPAFGAGQIFQDFARRGQATAAPTAATASRWPSSPRRRSSHGKPLSELIGTKMPAGDWARAAAAGDPGRQAHHRPARPFVVPEPGLPVDLHDRGGHGRQAVRATPPACIVHNDEFNHILMAMETEITKDGVTYKDVQGTAEEHKTLAGELRAPLQAARRGDLDGHHPARGGVGRPQSAPEVASGQRSGTILPLLQRSLRQG